MNFFIRILTLLFFTTIANAQVWHKDSIIASNNWNYNIFRFGKNKIYFSMGEKKTFIPKSDMKNAFEFFLSDDNSMGISIYPSIGINHKKFDDLYQYAKAMKEEALKEKAALSFDYKITKVDGVDALYCIYIEKEDEGYILSSAYIINIEYPVSIQISFKTKYLDNAKDFLTDIIPIFQRQLKEAVFIRQNAFK